MPTNAIACRTSIRRFKRANYQLIDQLNFVPNKVFGGGKVPGTGLPAHCENTQQVLLHDFFPVQKHRYLIQAVKVLDIITTRTLQ
jgi:hypothetical protein